MSNLKLIHRLGLFVAEDVLSQDECLTIISEFDKAETILPGIVNEDGLSQVNPEIRRVKKIDLSARSLELVQGKLLTIKPQLEAYFNLPLNSFEYPQMLKYNQGDFYQPHADTNNLINQPENIRIRKISVVVFLNQSGVDSPKSNYQGGALTFYGLIKKESWQNYGFPLHGKPGLLIAFPAQNVHEVEPVTHGTRYTIVTWFS